MKTERALSRNKAGAIAWQFIGKGYNAVIREFRKTTPAEVGAIIEYSYIIKPSKTDKKRGVVYFYNYEGKRKPIQDLFK